MLTCQIAAVTPARNSLRPGRESCDRPGHSARGRLGESLITRGTVCCETPARRATSAITTDLSGRRTTSVALRLAVRAEGAVALNQMASPAAGVGEEVTLKRAKELNPTPWPAEPQAMGATKNVQDLGHHALTSLSPVRLCDCWVTAKAPGSMEDMGRPYTSGVWTVKPGREEDFVARWGELAEWASTEFPSAGQPTLLRDMDEPRRFVSFGAWNDMEQIDAFRQHAEFARNVARIREALDDFSPFTYEAVIEP
jgi:heme-degrading monooxygenase HmoA